MLPEINRLKKEKDFERAFKKGKGSKEDFLYLKVVKNNLENSRFGFIISKKFSKKAVIRNKIRRRLSRLIEIKLPKIKKGIDAAITVMPGLEIGDFWELEDKMNKLFKKSGILK